MSCNLQTKENPYTSHRGLKEKDERIKKLKEEVAKLQKELKEERNIGKKESGYSREHKRRFKWKPIRKGLEEKGLSSSFYEERKGTCRFCNEGGQLKTVTQMLSSNEWKDMRGRSSKGGP